MNRIFYAFLLFAFGIIKSIAQPSITGILVPQYMCDTTRGTGENARTPVIVRAKITGLTANATYRYQTKAVNLFYMNGANPAGDGATSTGAGNPLYLRQTGNFNVTSSPSFSTAGGYDSLLANGSGEYEGWFGIEPTANARFAPGNYIHLRIVLNSGVTGNTTSTHFLTISDSSKTMAYGTATANGTGVWSKSMATDKNIAVLWDNLQATGRPIGCAIIENDGYPMRSAVSPANPLNYPLYLRNNVDTIVGSWGTIIPNNNSNGIRRIDNRKFSDGSIVYANLDADGVWPTGNVSTVNPAGGYSAIKLDSSDVPLAPNPTVYFSSATYSVNENGTSVAVSVKHKNPAFTNTSATVILKSGGSATSGTDFTYSSTTLTFTPTDTIKTMNIAITDDILVEGNETFLLAITNVNNGGLIGTDSVATVTIVDNDFTSPIFYFNQIAYSVSESGTNITIAVKYKNQATTATTVDVALKAGGSATEGSDFSFTGATLSFSSTDTMNTVVIPISNDVLVEGNETFILRLTNQTSGCLLSADSVTTTTIIDDDFPAPVVSLALAKQSVGEGAGMATISVKLSAPAPAPVTVLLSGSNGTATNADYNFTSTNLNFAIGDSIKTATVTITDDAIVEGSEYFVMLLSNATGATLGNASDTVTINDNDFPSLPIGQISTVNATTGLPDSLGKKYVIAGVVYGINYRPSGLQFVIRDNTGGITIFKSTGNYGYSVKEGDSVRVPGTVAQFNGLTEFNADTVILLGSNKTIKTPTVITKLGEVYENDLVRINGVQFNVPITNWPTTASNISVHNATDTIVIRLQLANTDILGTVAPTGSFDIIGLGSQFDNSNPYTSGYQLFPRFLSDIIPGLTPATITVDTASVTVAENAGTVRMKLKITNVNGSAATVNIAQLGTATPTTDYTAPATTATFPANAVNGDSIMVTYTIIDDAVSESAETIIVNVTPASNATVSGGSKTITITDNDVAPAVISIDTATMVVNENAGIVKVKVKIRNVNGMATTAILNYTGTATSGTDYFAPTATITFPSSAVNGDSIMVSYSITDDLLYEPLTETIITTYTAGANCSISGGTMQTIRITDNEPNGIGSVQNQTAIKIYPNPSSGMVNIVSDIPLQTVKLFDITGNEIQVLHPNANAVALNQIASGMYLLYIQTATGVSTQKLLVK